MNIGIHFSNKYWEAPSEEDFRRLRDCKPECIKTLIFSEPRYDQVAVHRRLKEEHPEALIVARLFADMNGGPWPADQFVRDFNSHIELVKDWVQWFEVHNEPNIDPASGVHEGFGPNDADFVAFRDWFNPVLDGLEANHPWARWVFPGNAIHRYWEFWHALKDEIARCDAWGVHCYWQFDHHTDPTFGRCYERAHQLLPDMPILITEFGDSTIDRSPQEKIAVYDEWYREVDRQPYVMGTALYILGGTQDWINSPGMPNFDVTAEMAVAIGNLPRQPRVPEVVDGFDYPVGAPDGEGYYVAAGLAEQAYYDRFGYWHTGEDWNGTGGGDSDLGDTVYAVAHGVVETARWFSGWGHVVLIRHQFEDGRVVWSQYAHLAERSVSRGDRVSRGDPIGTIGKGDGDQFPAHLHFELRSRDLPASKWGWTTEEDRIEVLQTYLHPSEFIGRYRPGQRVVTVTVDEDAGFARSDSAFWMQSDVGHDGHSWWTWTVSEDQGEDCVATWTPDLPHSGLYEVYVFVPRRRATTRSARYQITHRRGTDVVVLDQNDYYDEWVSLGVYAFSTAQTSQVRLSDVTGEPYTRDRATRKEIAFDAVLWVLVESQPRFTGTIVPGLDTEPGGARGFGLDDVVSAARRLVTRGLRGVRGLRSGRGVRRR